MGSIGWSGSLNIPVTELPFPIPVGWFKFDGKVSGVVSYEITRPLGERGRSIDVTLDPAALSASAATEIAEDLSVEIGVDLSNSLPGQGADPTRVPGPPGLVVGLNGSTRLGLRWSISTNTSDWLELFLISTSGGMPVNCGFTFQGYQVRITGGPRVTARIGLTPAGARAIGGRILQWARGAGGIAARVGQGALALLETSAGAAAFVAVVAVGGTIGSLCLIGYLRGLQIRASMTDTMRLSYCQAYVRTVYAPNENTYLIWMRGFDPNNHESRVQLVHRQRGHDAAHADMNNRGADQLRLDLGYHIVALHHRNIQWIQANYDTVASNFSQNLRNHAI